MRDSCRGLSVLLVIFILTGCVSVPIYKTHPNWSEKKESIRTIVLMPARVDVYQVTAGGVREKMDEWSSDAKKNVISAMVKELQDQRGHPVKIFSEDALSAEVASNLKETQGLYDAVNSSIIAHVYGPAPMQFPDKIAKFEYTLGKEVKGLITKDTDAILMVWGVDHVFTKGNITKQIATGVVLGLLTGVVPVQRKMTYMSMALVDPDTGSVLWYRYMDTRQGGGYDLRDADSAAGMVKTVLSNFPSVPGHGGDQK